MCVLLVAGCARFRKRGPLLSFPLSASLASGATALVSPTTTFIVHCTLYLLLIVQMALLRYAECTPRCAAPGYLSEGIGFGHSRRAMMGGRLVSKEGPHTRPVTGARGCLGSGQRAPPGVAWTVVGGVGRRGTRRGGCQGSGA